MLNKIENLQLSPKKEKFVNNLIKQLTLDNKTIQLSLYFYNEFMKSNQNKNKNDFNLIFRLAVFISSKAQIVKTITGETKKGIGLKLTTILKNSNWELDLFLIYLKKFLEILNINNEVKDDLYCLLHEFSYLNTFYNKFEELFKKIESKENLKNSLNSKNYIWLFFLILRKISDFGNQNFLEDLCLLSKCFIDFLNFITKNDYNNIKNYIFNILNIKDEGLFNSINEKFNNIIKELVSNNLINLNYLDENSIIYNYKNWKNYYSKLLDIEEIDGRYFIEDKKVNYSPSKFTPFAKQGNFYKNINTYKNLTTNENFKNSHRILNYDNIDKIKITSKLKDIYEVNNFKFDKMQSSPYNKNIQNHFTPMTTAIHLYNWLYEKIHKKKIYNNGKLIEENIYLSPQLKEYLSILDAELHYDILKNNIERIVNNIIIGESNNQKKSLNKKTIESRKDLMINFYFNILQEIWKLEYSKNNKKIDAYLKNPDFHKALLSCCIESIYFILNIDCLKINFIIKICELNSFDLWNYMFNIIKFYNFLPNIIKNHFLNIEGNIIGNLVWKEKSEMKNLISELNSIYDFQENILSMSLEISGNNYVDNNILNQSEIDNSFFDKLFEKNKINQKKQEEIDSFIKRLLLFAANLLMKLSYNLNLKDLILESIWELIKIILIKYNYIIHDRHLDQIIMCSVYCICKSHLKFNEIIGKYKEIKEKNNKNLLIEIIYKVKLDDQEINLISFYNNFFIKELEEEIIKIKSFLKNNIMPKNFKTPGNNLKQTNTTLKSPLKNLVSTPFISKNLNDELIKYDYKIDNKLKSPTSNMLKINDKMDNPIKNNNLKKIINFENELSNNFNDKKIEKNIEKSDDNIKEISDFFLKNKMNKHMY